MDETVSTQKDPAELPPLETDKDEGEESDEYWTPERMRDAKPIELHPDTSPDEEKKPEPDPRAEGGDGGTGPSSE